MAEAQTLRLSLITQMIRKPHERESCSNALPRLRKKDTHTHLCM